MHIVHLLPYCLLTLVSVLILAGMCVFLFVAINHHRLLMVLISTMNFYLQVPIQQASLAVNCAKA